MPYVNIPESGLGGAVAKIVGKLQGKVSAQVLTSATEITNKLYTSGCPSKRDIQRLRQQKERLDNALSGIDNRLSRFRNLPRKLRVPLRGLNIAKRIILTLPIPQSVPPGFGLPINLTTKYADTLHLLKELIKQVDELIQSIDIVLETPTLTIGGLKSNLSRVDNVIKACEAEAALQDELDNGNISTLQLQNLGLLDDNEIFIFSKLGPRLLSTNSNTGIQGTSTNSSDLKFKGKWTDQREYEELDKVDFNGERWVRTDGQEKSDEEKNLPPGSGPWNKVEEEEIKGINDLNSALEKINDSTLSEDIKDRLRSILDGFNLPNLDSIQNDPNFYHTGPNGIVYKLEILTDPQSPSIAPRRFAVAKDAKGVVVLKGPKSFSSSTKVLLDEIKFRIDNQLP